MWCFLENLEEFGSVFWAFVDFRVLYGTCFWAQPHKLRAAEVATPRTFSLLLRSAERKKESLWVEKWSTEAVLDQTLLREHQDGL